MPVHDESSDAYWLGLTLNPDTNQVISMQNQTSVQFSNWDQNQPKPAEGFCIAFNLNIQWISRDCQKPAMAVCQVGKIISSTQTWDDNGCSNNKNIWYTYETNFGVVWNGWVPEKYVRTCNLRRRSSNVMTRKSRKGCRQIRYSFVDRQIAKRGNTFNPIQSSSDHLHLT